MRCAYLILAHRNPDQLARLVASLTVPASARSTADRAYIHIDRRTDLTPYRAALSRICPEEAYEFITRREVTAWGDFSLVQATLKLMEAALAEEGFDTLSLLSGQDYPLVSVTQLKRRLSVQPDAEHLSYFDLPYDRWAPDGGLGRFRKYHNPGLRERIRTSGIPGARYLGAAVAMLLASFPRRRGVPGELSIRGGWQWWTLTPACARYVLDYAARHPALVRFFRFASIPDELFFQTVILNSPFARNVTGDYLRYIVWEGVKPRVFGEADLPELFQASARSLFARKFDLCSSGGAAVLDALDRWRDSEGLVAEYPMYAEVGDGA